MVTPPQIYNCYLIIVLQCSGFSFWISKVNFQGKFPVFGLNTGKYGPEKTPYLDTFHAAILFNNHNIEIFKPSDIFRWLSTRKRFSWFRSTTSKNVLIILTRTDLNPMIFFRATESSV